MRLQNLRADQDRQLIERTIHAPRADRQNRIAFLRFDPNGGERTDQIGIPSITPLLREDSGRGTGSRH